jgi:hypothetical protein
MARICYREISFRPERLSKIIQINKILGEYERAVSVRQLFYRIVAAALIENNKGEYDKIQNLVTEARYAGLIDWNAIEDRGREAVKTQDWPSGRAALDETIEDFRLDRWINQPFYVELWVEKDALAGVLSPITKDYHITLFPTRGYNSTTAMKEAADRLTYRSRGRKGVVLYIGDHDPSGLHMTEDVRTRLAEFGVPASLDVRRIALTWEQIQLHKPPPNRVKRRDDPEVYKGKKGADGSLADSRAQAYVDQFGEESWEADALPPKLLELETRKMISAYINRPKMTAMITKENLIKAAIKKLSAGFKEP